MTSEPFISLAQNAEDVVLYRALRHVENGRYLEIGANDPMADSISRAFYDRGWSGITVEPMHDLVQAHRTQRPRDAQVEAVAGAPGIDTAVLHEIAGTGLSSVVDEVGRMHDAEGLQVHEVEVPSLTVDQILEQHSPTGELHFVVIDTEGAEGAVLEGFDLRRWRPWVLVIEATKPNSRTPSHGSWEPGVLAAGYRLCLFDGLSRFYVADEHADELGDLLSAPANTLDHWIRHDEASRRDQLDLVTRQAVRWRTVALERWVQSIPDPRSAESSDAVAERDRLDAELTAMRRTLSWRITRPIRLVRRLVTR